MLIRIPVAIALLLGTAVVGCQHPFDGEDAGASDASSGPTPPTASRGPGGEPTPIAPAIEPSHPDAERTLKLPESIDVPKTTEPVAPAIEIEPLGPDPTFPAEPE